MRRRPKIKCVKNVWYYVFEDGTKKPVWDEDEGVNNENDFN